MEGKSLDHSVQTVYVGMYIVAPVVMSLCSDSFFTTGFDRSFKLRGSYPNVRFHSSRVKFSRRK